MARFNIGMTRSNTGMARFNIETRHSKFKTEENFKKRQKLTFQLLLPT